MVNFFDRRSGTLVTFQSHDSMGAKAFLKLSKDPQVTEERYQSDDYQMLAPKYLTKERKHQI